MPAEPLPFPGNVRLRPGMYIGSAGPAGVVHLMLEVVSNVYDQFLAGHATRLGVEVDGSVCRVSDDGAGLPFDEVTVDGAPFVEHHLTNIHHTGSADDHAPHVHPRSFGVGLAVVNALTSHLTITSTRAGQRWEQRFARGVALGPAECLGPTDVRGTVVEWEPDAEIFETTLLDVEAMRNHFFIAAHLYPGLTVTFCEERFHRPAGLASLLDVMRPDSRWRPSQRVHVRSERLSLELAFANRTSRSTEPTRWRSWVNGSEMVEGGTHHEGARRAFAAAEVDPDDVLMHVVMMEPEFAGPTKGKLATEWVRDEIERTLTIELSEPTG